MQAATGKAPPELITPGMPAGLAHLMAWFDEIGLARRSGMASPDPLSWSDIAAWSSLTGQALAPWEVRALRALDAAWISAWNEAQTKDRAR